MSALAAVVLWGLGFAGGYVAADNYLKAKRGRELAPIRALADASDAHRAAYARYLDNVEGRPE